MQSYAGNGSKYWRGVPCWRTDFLARAGHFGIKNTCINIQGGGLYMQYIYLESVQKNQSNRWIITVLLNYCHFLYPFELKTYFSQFSAAI